MRLDNFRVARQLDIISVGEDIGRTGYLAMHYLGVPTPLDNAQPQSQMCALHVCVKRLVRNPR